MSPEALARLRSVAEFSREFNDPPSTQRHVNMRDLRALLDAYAALEKDRDEAFEALRRMRDVTRGRTHGLPLNEAMTRADRIAAAVLANAGRR